MTFAKIISQKQVFKRFFSLDVVEAAPKSLRRDGYGVAIEREVLRGPDVASVLLYNPATDELLLNRQFRMGVFLRSGGEDPFLIETATGCMDEGETPEACAVREALEETGCVVRDLEFMASCYPGPGAMDQKYFMYIGCIDAAEPGFHGVEEEGEEIETFLVTAARAIEMLDNNEISNAPTTLMLHWFARNHDRLRKKWKKP